jgi:hypothetical protein
MAKLTPTRRPSLERDGKIEELLEQKLGSIPVEELEHFEALIEGGCSEGDAINQAAALSDIPAAERANYSNALKLGRSYRAELNRAEDSQIDALYQSLMKAPAPHKKRQDRGVGTDDNDEPRGRSLNSLYLMVLGMAIAKYDFDPSYNPKDDDESSSIGKIERDLRDVARTPVGLKTVRGHLLKAIERANTLGLKPRTPKRAQSKQ